MKTMKKIVAILAVALLLCSMLPLSVMAADGDVYELVTDINELAIGDQVIIAAVNDNFAMSTEQKSNNRGQVAATKNGNSIAYVANLQVFTVEAGSIDGTYAFNTGDGYIYAAGGTGKNNYLRTEAALSGNSSWNIEIAADGIATIKSAGGAARNWLRHNKSSSLFSCYASGQNDIAIYKLPTGVECDHSALSCGATCSVCGEVIDHEYVNNCDATCEQCGASRDIPGHEYSGALDTSCNNCGEIREVVLPTDPTEIVDAAYGLDQGEAFPSAVQLTGVITSVDTVYSEQYGNVTVTIDVIDANGNLIEGKAIQCYRLKGTGADVIAVGDTITVSGILKNYNGKIEFDTGCTLVSYEQTGCKHEYKYECSTTCELCGKGEREAKCESDAEFLCQEGSCNHCGETVAALDHAFDDQWDADCNYGCGYTREVEEKPDMTEATITFDADKTQRVDFTTDVQVWENGGLNLTNNKASSTTNIGDYTNPGRFYKSSEIIISFPGMTQLVIDCSNAGEDKYITPWGDMLTAAGLTYTVAEKVYTITFAEPVDSITLSCSAQVRANSITATAVKVGDDECTHQWSDATCTTPKTCTLCGAIEGAALGHDWEIISENEATCTTSGSIVYECATCGEDKSETSPALPHNFEDGKCSVCGFVKPVVIDAPKAGVAYKFGMIQGNVSDTDVYYLKGGMDGYYMATAADAAAAIDVYLEETDGGYYMYTMVDGAKTYINMVVSGTHVNGAYEAAASTVYTYNADSKTVIAIVNDAEYWFGTRNDKTYTTVGPCAVSYAGFYCQFYGTPCAHEYFSDCDKICLICGEESRPEAAHSVKHVDAKAATCAENGNIEYWFCEACGMAWLNAECTLNTNLRAVVLPATGEHTYDDEYDADCNVCGDIRDVPEKPVTGVVYGDANGDGDVTVLDEILISQYVAGWDVDLDLTASDANGDGDVTVLDEILVSQYVAGWDVQLGPDEPVEPEETPKFNDGEIPEWPQN